MHSPMTPLQSQQSWWANSDSESEAGSESGPTCGSCGAVRFTSGADGFLYCEVCGQQSQQGVAEEMEVEDVMKSASRVRGRIMQQKIRSPAGPKSLSQKRGPMERPLPDAETCLGAYGSVLLEFCSLAAALACPPDCAEPARSDAVARVQGHAFDVFFAYLERWKAEADRRNELTEGVYR